MTDCERCGYPVVPSPHGDRWCSVWGTHTYVMAPPAEDAYLARHGVAGVVRQIIEHEREYGGRSLRVVS